MTPMLTSQQFEESVRNDPLNKSGVRNQRNTPVTAYNCGGFALSTYDWLCPYVRTDDSTDKYDLPDGTYTDEEREFIIEHLIEDGWTEADIEEEILHCDVNFLLGEYPFLEPVELAECDLSDTVIAYRIFINIDEELGIVEDTDFHFKVRINGFWFEKMGNEPIRLCQLEDANPWVVNEELQYTSSIAYFCINKT